MSSKRQDWGTPIALIRHFEALTGRRFGIDVAAAAYNAKCPIWLGPGSPFAEDALSADWFEVWRVAMKAGPEARCRAWLNPPYGDAVGTFLEAAVRRVRAEPRLEVFALVAARVDTEWFNAAIEAASAVFFLAGRVAFEVETAPGAKPTIDSAPFPSAVLWLTSHGGAPAVHWGHKWKPARRRKGDRDHGAESDRVGHVRARPRRATRRRGAVDPG